MSQDSKAADTAPVEAGASLPARTLAPAAQRALAEAEARRVKAADEAAKAKEYNGRGGLEPVRFGDWEVKGLATDF